MEERRLSTIITKEQESTFLGDILRRHMGLSFALVRRIKFLPRGILLDGTRVPTRFLGKEGQELSAYIGETGRKSQFLPHYGPLDIIHEDQDFLVINKDANVVVHPTPNHWDDTLGNFLLYYYDEVGFAGDFHPVHRLDRGTTGLLVVAKHPFAQEQFTRQIHSPIFCREYLALCWGVVHPDKGTVNAPIYQKEKMIRCVDSRGQKGITHFTVVGRGTYQGISLSLVALRLETGRTHQIRVHMSYKGNPLLGDELYGQGDVLEHTALHAFRLSLKQPVTQEDLVFTVAPPPDFQAILQEAGISLPNYDDISRNYENWGMDSQEDPS